MQDGADESCAAFNAIIVAKDLTADEVIPSSFWSNIQ